MEQSMEVRMRGVEDTLARIETKLDTTLVNVSDHEKRLRTLEGKSGKRWDALIGQIISVVAAAVIGGFVGHFIK